MNTDMFVTPYKYPSFLLEASGKEGDFSKYGIDIPFVFFHNNQFFMLCTGFNGEGYQSAFAVSHDLLHWEYRNLLLPPDQENRWDSQNTGCACLLKEYNDLEHLPLLKKFDNKYWMVYESYPESGYEAGAAQIGLAWCEDDDLLDWHRLGEPILSWKDGNEWERGGMYNTCLLFHEEKFYLFYNAKDRNKVWKEQIGAAVSGDLLHWKRLSDRPLVSVSDNGFDSRFVSNPYLVKVDNKWIMFYFGFDTLHAQEGIAWGDDLFHWEKSDKPFLTYGGRGEIDEIHAHKPCVIYWNDRLYHFYCGVRKAKPEEKNSMYSEVRGICVASSKPFEGCNL